MKSRAIRPTTMRLIGVVGLILVGCGPAFTARSTELLVVDEGGLAVDAGTPDGDPGKQADAGPESSQDAFSDPEGGVDASDASAPVLDAGIDVEASVPIWDGRVCGSQGAPCITSVDCCAPYVCGSDQVCNPS